MQEFVFNGLMAAVILAVMALLYAAFVAFRSKGEDDFYASYQASTERYQKRYKGNWVARGSTRPHPPATESAESEEPEEKAQWLRDLEEGDGSDKRFWTPES